MKSILFIILLCCPTFILGALTPSASHLPQSSELSAPQTHQIEQVVHHYLVEHPEVLVEASESLRKQEFEKERRQGLEMAKKNTRLLFGSSSDFIIGNPQGDVTLIEFFDYQCPHCEEMEAILNELIKSNPNLRVVLKDLPIYGPVSFYAVSATFAANNQNKYHDLHTALLTPEAPLSEKTILTIAKKVGLNITKLKQDILSQQAAVKSKVEENFSLAKQLHLRGTPMFFIAKTDIVKNPNLPIEFLPGAIPKGVLEAGIKKIDS